MTREQFVEKWSTFLSGKFSRFAFCETSGPGLEKRLRVMVQDIESTVAKMYSDARDDTPRQAAPANGATAGRDGQPQPIKATPAPTGQR